MKNLIFPIILISSIILLLASFYTQKTKNKTTLNITCSKQIECQVFADTTDNSNCLILETTNKTILYPVLEANDLMLVENSKVRVCYSNIDSTNPAHKTIFINKVVFLP